MYLTATLISAIMVTTEVSTTRKEYGMADGRLIKIDRNGSKHYEGWIRCDRCSGRGLFATGTVNGQLRITPVDNGVCHKCWGSGKVWSKWIERTPEYEAVLAEKREIRAAKRAAEIAEQQRQEYAKNATESLEKWGIPEGKLFLILNDSDRDSIKAAGGRFEIRLGWYIGRPVDGMETMEVEISKVFRQNDWGRYEVSASKDEVDAIKVAEMEKRHPMNWIGEVGKRMTIPATYMYSAHFEVKAFVGYGTEIMYIHNFRDENGNQLVWKTGRGLGDTCVEGDKVSLTGTVKEHSEYKGQKQTILTRCKIVREKA